jgi:hypothetical protein
MRRSCIGGALAWLPGLPSGFAVEVGDLVGADHDRVRGCAPPRHAPWPAPTARARSAGASPAAAFRPRRAAATVERQAQARQQFAAVDARSSRDQGVRQSRERSGGMASILLHWRDGQGLRPAPPGRAPLRRGRRRTEAASAGAGFRRASAPNAGAGAEPGAWQAAARCSIRSTSTRGLGAPGGRDQPAAGLPALPEPVDVPAGSGPLVPLRRRRGHGGGRGRRVRRRPAGRSAAASTCWNWSKTNC